MTTFTCDRCHITYPWPMKGGTGKLVANPKEYADRYVKTCCYCVGVYADGTRCNRGSK